MKLKLTTAFFASPVLLFFIMFSPNAFGETYTLEIDDVNYSLDYSFEGDVIAMAVDKETISLLIATENVEDSIFQITLPDELIRAENNEFAVLVNGIEVGYEVNEFQGKQLSFFVPAFTEEIEIIGTFVVPEFPLGLFLMMAGVVGVILAVQKSQKRLFR